jgi:hypothetical protein
MCLAIGEKRFYPPLEVDKIGWKVFQVVPGGYIGCYQEKYSYKAGQRYDAEMDHCWYVPPYGAGFHILAHRKDAERLRDFWNSQQDTDRHVVRRVHFSKVVAVGEAKGRCAVAREMTILEN